MSQETLDFMERHGIEVIEYQEKPDTRDVEIVTTDLKFQAANGVTTTPSSLDSGARQVMFDFASRYSSESPAQTLDFLRYLKLGKLSEL